MTLGDDSLAGYYKTMFDLMHIWHWSIAEMEEMYPFELDIYTDLLARRLREQKMAREAK